MGGLIKLIFTLILLTGVAVYGGDIWSKVKEKVTGTINPELQRANLLDSFKNGFSEIENKIKEVSKNIDNPDFDKKAKLEEVVGLIGESKNNLTKIEQSDSTLVEKTFEALNDLKEGTQNLFNPENKNTQNNQCDIENN